MFYLDVAISRLQIFLLPWWCTMINRKTPEHFPKHWQKRGMSYNSYKVHPSEYNLARKIDILAKWFIQKRYDRSETETFFGMESQWDDKLRSLKKMTVGEWWYIWRNQKFEEFRKQMKLQLNAKQQHSTYSAKTENFVPHIFFPSVLNLMKWWKKTFLSIRPMQIIRNLLMQ